MPTTEVGINKRAGRRRSSKLKKYCVPFGARVEMLDLFSIFTKGGIVLWCFQGTALSLSPAVNALIKTVILQVSQRMDQKTGLTVTSLFRSALVQSSTMATLLSSSRWTMSMN